MMTAHRFDQTILREYDIRGIVGDTLHGEDAYAIGRTFGTMLRNNGGQSVAIGYDGRLSSPSLSERLATGLSDAGVSVHNIGLGPTPMLYYAVHLLNTDGGIQITGSHNPPDYNGFKMMMGKRSFFGAQIQELGQIAARGEWQTGQGAIIKEDIFESYIARLMQDYHGTREIDVVWDAGNGAAGPAMERLAAAIPGRHKTLFADIDGNFPNHHPDPTEPHNLVDLIAAVKDGGYELGIGFDGDGDRIGVVDAQGRIVWGDQILQLLANDIITKYPGATIIADVKASRLFFDHIRNIGGQPLMYKTGHSLIKEKMIELDAPLSGEMSGHIFYKDSFYGHDDALYVAVRLLDILARGSTSMSDFVDTIPEIFNTPEIRFDCDDNLKFGVVQNVKAQLEADNADFSTIDGVRVSTHDGWWLLRASNTQSVLVARAESTSEDGLNECKSQLKKYLTHAGVEVDLF